MTEDKFVTQDAFDTFAKAVSNKVNFLETLISNTIVRQETLLKLMCPKGEAPTFDAFVAGLRKYDAFIAVLKEVRSIAKMSERIDAALKYNAANPDAFPLMADDINVLEQANEAESVSKSNYDKALQLPNTKMFETQLGALLTKTE